MADINVTPLIDVVLVLLVVFMVITPMLKSGKQVDLQPAFSATTSSEADKYIVVSIVETAEGEPPEWWVEDEPADTDSLITLINNQLLERVAHFDNVGKEASNRNLYILIKADKDLEYGLVREVVDLIGENTAGRTLKLATEKERT